MNANDAVSLARQAITTAFWESSLFRRTRSNALYHYAAALEEKVVQGQMAANLDDANLSLFQSHRLAVESSSKILPAIFSRCQEGDSPLSFSVEAYQEAERLIELAADWDAIDYSFELVEKGQQTLTVDPERSCLTFKYSDSDADQTDTLMRSRELDVTLLGERGRPNQSALMSLGARLYGEIQQTIRISGHEQCSYEYTKKLCDLLGLMAVEFVKAVPHEMDDAVLVDDFSFADLRRLWGALIAISQTHLIAHSIAMNIAGTFPRRSMVFHKSQADLSAIVSRVSGLAPAMAVRLITIHTYDSGFHAPHSYQGPALQPLLPLTTHEICVPSPLINGNNFERNFFKLLHRHPWLRRFAAAVEALKESIAMKALDELFSKAEYRTKIGIKISGVTDIDFVAYEIKTGFALLIEHKWLIPPETATESSSNDEKLASGISQAQKAHKYAAERPEFLHQLFNLSETDKISQIESVVVCRGFEQTGFMGDGDIPVIMEVAFRMMIEESADLPAAWNKLKLRPDREKSATKIVDVARTISIGGYDFVLPYLAKRL